MRTLITALLLSLAASTARAQEAPGAKAGYVHCESVALLRTQARILGASGVRAWHAWMQASEGECHVSDGEEGVEVVRITGDENEPVTVGDKVVVCLRSETWNGCHYAFRGAVWTPEPKRGSP